MRVPARRVRADLRFLHGQEHAGAERLYQFSPVTAEELGGLRFEVNGLHSREEVTLENELDPRRYGVIVSTMDSRSSLLLPGIKEIRLPEQQLRPSNS